MAETPKTQTDASTVALADLAEAITSATLRALAERKLVPSDAATLEPGKFGIPTGEGGTVLGIVIPPWERGGGIGGLGPCHHHTILGIVIMPKGGLKADESADAGKGPKA
jgi:hypothetical protein